MFIYYGLLGFGIWKYYKYRNPYFEETGLFGPPIGQDIQDKIDKEKEKQLDGISWRQWDDYLIYILGAWVVLSTKPWK